MFKKILIVLFAMCWLAAAQTVMDGAGVTVSLNGAEVLHRPAVIYPVVSRLAGVQGTVVVQLKLDSTGMVSDAQVLGGPEELRKTVLQSVLQWHFTHEFAGTTHSVDVRFEPKEPGEVAVSVNPLAGMTPVPPPVESSSKRVQRISVIGLPQHSAIELMASLPVREGDEWNLANWRKVTQAVYAYDEHLTVQMMLGPAQASGEREMNLMIAAPASNIPNTIKVGGNVQGAMVLKKVAPVYPPDAKAAGVSGVVHLAATIGRDGTVQSLSVVSGPPELTQAALDAVKQWVYRPTLLNNNPVEVDTTIDINFTLNQ